MKAPKIIEDQLNHFYNRIHHDRDNSIKIRNWCITIWLSLLALVNSNQLNLSKLQVLILPLMAISIFWILDAYQYMFILLNERRAREIEDAIVNEKYDPDHANEYFLLRVAEVYSYKIKLKTFLRASFLSETIVIFYLLLTIGTIIFQIILK